jgi:hypothetical protein
VTLTDLLPEGLSLVQSSQGCSGTDQITCRLGGIPMSAKAFVELVVATTRTGTMTNTVKVLGDLEDPNPADNSATKSVEVKAPPPPTPARADLAVALTGPSEVPLATSWNDTVTVTNNGPDRAEKVEVVFEIPSGYAVLAASLPSGAGCVSEGIVCALGSLEAGTKVTITRTLTAAVAGSFQNSVQVRSSTQDPDPSNDQQVQEMTVTSIGEPSGSPSPPSTPIDPPSSPSSGFGCGMVAPGSKGNTFRRSDSGDLLLLSFPFFYAAFRRRRHDPGTRREAAFKQT